MYVVYIINMDTNMKLIKALAMKKYRQALKEKNPEEYLAKQRMQKAKIRKTRKTADFHGIEFELPVSPTPSEEPMHVEHVLVEPQYAVEHMLVEPQYAIDAEPPEGEHVLIEPQYAVDAEPPEGEHMLVEPQYVTLSALDFDAEPPEGEPISICPAMTEPPQEFLELSTDSLLSNALPVELLTLKRYVNDINRLSKIITNKPMEQDMLFLMDVPTVQNCIETLYKNYNTITSYYKSIVSVLRRVNFDVDIIEKYSILMMASKKQAEDLRGENHLTKRERLNYVEWPELLNMSIIDKSPEDQLLYTLVTALPVRRLDYKYLTLADNTMKLSKRLNYIIVNNGTPSKLIYNNFKTAKSHGGLVIDLNQNDTQFFNYTAVREAISNWFNKSPCELGKLIFPTTTGTVYSDFSRRFHMLFNNFEPRLVSSNILRYSYLTHIHQQDICLNTLKVLAKHMSSSVVEGLAYRKFKSPEQKLEFLNSSDA
jgi:hypothetical protein